MADYLALIAGLNSDSPVDGSITSPEDFSAELSMWTNAEFTFDTTPGLGIFESDSGFTDLLATNTATPVAPVDPTTTTTFNTLDFMNFSQERPLSLLERTRQRNPVQAEQSTISSQITSIPPTHTYQTTPQNVAPIVPIAPVTPAAAKLLRQPMPQYHKPTLISKPKSAVPTVPTVSAVPSAFIKSPLPDTTTVTDNTITTPFEVEVEVEVEQKSSASVLGEKRKSTADHDVADGYEVSAEDSFSKDDPEYLTKVAAEEDKRKRNTAASARFRQKKKLREQALEQTAKEQTLRAEGLENRVRELEMEVRWLRGLIVEKDSRLHAATMTLQRLDVFQ
ncbi:hypothetical protein BGX29_011511 [Mortierella sp. GBA35]|nr:hypothetical protein BGX29_011511 [Mortierella sp. GBA35]